MDSKRYVLCKAALFLTAIIWGSTFVVIKGATDAFSFPFLIAFRFTAASVVLGAVFYRKLRLISWEYIKSGGIIGFFLFLGYILQTMGLSLDTTPGKSAFLTAIYCVLVPFLSWAVCKARPDKYNFSAAILCIIGIGLVSLDGALSMTLGDFVTLLGGLCCAANIVATAVLAKDRDTVVLTLVEFFVIALLAWALTAVTGSYPKAFPVNAVMGVMYLAVFATALCLLLQTIGIKYTNPSSASIILSLEAVFGVLFSIWFYHEKITAQLMAGFVLIFISVLISETKLSFLKRKASVIEKGTENI